MTIHVIFLTILSNSVPLDFISLLGATCGCGGDVATCVLVVNSVRRTSFVQGNDRRTDDAVIVCAGFGRG